MEKIKNILIWLRWKLFYSIDFSTCGYIGRKSLNLKGEYRKFLDSAYPLPCKSWQVNFFDDIYPTHYNLFRRDAMWRFLVKGERGEYE